MADTVEKKEEDFFAGHEAIPEVAVPAVTAPVKVQPATATAEHQSDGPAPNVEAFSNPTVRASAPTKSLIGQRKPASKLSNRKGLGATKIQTNFDDIEREAQLADSLKSQKPAQQQAQGPSVVESEPQMSSLRLAYQDLSMETKKQSEKLQQKVDPNKAQHLERLGMGILSSGSRYTCFN